MNISSKIKVFAIAIILLACCNHADARRPLRHYINRTARVAVVHTPIHRHFTSDQSFQPKRTIGIGVGIS